MPRKEWRPEVLEANSLFSQECRERNDELKYWKLTASFHQECRERNDELKYWKLTASVKFSGYKFLGYGVTMKIAKAEAAIKALTYLDVLG